MCVCVSQEAADSLVEDFVITESAEAVEEAIAESTVLQVRGGTSLSAVATPHALLAPVLLWSPNSLQLPGGFFSLYFGPILSRCLWQLENPSGWSVCGTLRAGARLQCRGVMINMQFLFFCNLMTKYR